MKSDSATKFKKPDNCPSRAGVRGVGAGFVPGLSSVRHRSINQGPLFGPAVIAAAL